MSETAQALAKKLAFAMDHAKVDRAAIAKACDVTRQSVDSWLRTGRIAKNRLGVLVDMTGFPLAWWLDDKAPLQYPGAEQERTVAEYTDDAAIQLATLFSSLNSVGKLLALDLLHAIRRQNMLAAQKADEGAAIIAFTGESLSRRATDQKTASGKKEHEQRRNQHHRVQK